MPVATAVGNGQVQSTTAALATEFQRPNSAQKTCCTHHSIQGLPHTARVVRIGRTQTQQQNFAPQLSKQTNAAAISQFRIGAIPTVISNVTTVHKTAKNSNTPSQVQLEAPNYIQLSDFDESGEDFSHNNLALKDRDLDNSSPQKQQQYGATMQNWVTPMQPVVQQPRKAQQARNNHPRRSATVNLKSDDSTDVKHVRPQSKRRRVSAQNLAHQTSPCSEVQSEQSAKTHNLGGGMPSNGPSPMVVASISESYLAFELPSGALQQQLQPKVGKIFSRPKNRMLASTAPADTQGHFVPPTYDLDGGRQQTRFPQFEEESDSNFSLPVNEIQGAFSMKGLLNHEASHDSHHLKINAASSSLRASSQSKHSQSVAEDGLRTVPHDQTMYPETEEGLHALCDFPDGELPLSQRQAINHEDEPTTLMRYSGSSRLPVEVVQQLHGTRMRLHSNFTSIDCRFTQTSRLNLIGDVTPALPAESRIKRQASSIISVRTCIGRINMQNNTKSPKFDLYDGARDDDIEVAHSVCQTCCARRQVKREDEEAANNQLNQEAPIMFRQRINDEDDDRLVEEELRLDRRRGHPKHQSVLENRRSLSARLHYVTSSYSSHRFYHEFENRGKKHVMKGGSRRDDSASSRRHDKQKAKGPQRGHHHKQISPTESDQQHRFKKEIQGKNNRQNYNQLSFVMQQRRRRSGSRQDGHRPSTFSRNQPYYQEQHQGERGVQPKDYHNRYGGARSSNVSYFSSTQFPAMNQHLGGGGEGNGKRQENNTTLTTTRNQGGNQHQSKREANYRPRSRSRLHSRGYSNSSSGSRHHHRQTSKATSIKRRMTMTLQDRSNAASGTGVLREGCRSVRRQNTMQFETGRRVGGGDNPRELVTNYARDNHSSKHGGQLLDCHSSTYSRRSRRQQERRDSTSPHHQNQQHKRNHSGSRTTTQNRTNDQKMMRQNPKTFRGTATYHQRDEGSQYHDTKDAFYSRTTTKRKPTSIHGGNYHHHQRHHHHHASYKPQNKSSYYHRSTKHDYHHHRYHHSRGKGSFKTQNERLYRRSRSRHLSSYSSRGGRSLMSSYSRGPPISSFHRSKKFPSQRSSDSPAALPTGSVQIDRSKDAGHFEWRKNMVLSSCDPLLSSVASQADSNRYLIVDHLGDGTFGRALKCVELPAATNAPTNELQLPNAPTETQEKSTYAVKVVRAVPRYTESAKFEAQILKNLHAQGGCERGIVYLKETFTNKSRQSYGNVSNMCLVFEPLGKSLYDFIKDNGYKGFEIGQVREIAIQSLHAIEFLHSLKLTHTDLKPENILLKYDAKETITDEANYPIQVQSKRSIYGSQKCSDIDDSHNNNQDSSFSGQSQQVRGRKWYKPTSCEIKVIDFGGATYEHERHTLIINTRQYRAPEVILENHTWDEKTDLWSMACILVELYTGELFFDTDENLEHLAMIEKQCGPIPLSMAQRCSNDQIKRQLHRDGSREEETYVKNKKMRLRWPAASLRAANRQAVTNMLLLDDIISDKWGEQHRQFKELLKSMLKIDPKERPSAQECLQNNFFFDIRKMSKSTEKTQVSTADHQFESPRQRQH